MASTDGKAEGEEAPEFGTVSVEAASLDGRAADGTLDHWDRAPLFGQRFVSVSRSPKPDPKENPGVLNVLCFSVLAQVRRC